MEPQIEVHHPRSSISSSTAASAHAPLHAHTPRRRISLSLTAHALHNPYHRPLPYPQPSIPLYSLGTHPPHPQLLPVAAPRRARTMPYPSAGPSRGSDRDRDHSHPYPYHPSRGQYDGPASSRTRKIVITLLVLLSLFLVGTVVVLSSVSYYLAIPSWAYLTESEVQWRPEDVIKPLRDPLGGSEVRARNVERRNEWRELSDSELDPLDSPSATATAAIGAAELDGLDDPLAGATTASAVSTTDWEALEEEMEELDAAEETDVPDEPEEPATTATSSVATTGPVDTTPSEAEDGVTPEVDGGSSADASSDVWGIDGKGSGGYWMRKDWDGEVQGTKSWDRLFNVTARPGETIPRLIHQTWKTNHLPEKWRKAWKECREGMPDYEYMLWTDDMSREFIAKHYPAHLHMFDSYTFPIQRADSIRYFILHHFGGVYMDLDIGCRRRLDPLLQGDWEVILPLTKPVGISNDLIFSAKGSAFMDDTVHGLAAFDHSYGSNYPTVMFSTGPMFLSAQYAIYSSSHPLTEQHPRAEIRVLPKSLYGKNAPIADVPHSFFSHFYGSSWHADDAGFITFLGTWGKRLMWLGLVVIVLGAIRLVWLKRTAAPGQQYQLLSILPTTRQSSSGGYDTPTSSSLGSGPTSPSSMHGIDMSLPNQLPSDIASVFKRAGNLILAAPATLLSGENRAAGGAGGAGGNGAGRRRRTGLLYFVPALFQPGPIPGRKSRGRTASEASQLPLRRSRSRRERERAGLEGGSGSAGLAPPPYDQLEEGSASGSHMGSRPSSRSGSRLGSRAGGSGKYGVMGKDTAMDEVDAFLNEADNEAGGSGSGSGGEGGYEDEEEPESAWDQEWKNRR